MKRLPHPWHFHFQFPIPSAPTFPSPTSSLEAMACFKQLKLVVDIRPCCCLCCKSAHNFTLSEHTRLLLGPGPALGFHQSDWHLSFPGTCLGFRADGITYFAKETPEVSLKCNKVECGVAESSIEVSPFWFVWPFFVIRYIGVRLPQPKLKRESTNVLCGKSIDSFWPTRYIYQKKFLPRIPPLGCCLYYILMNVAIWLSTGQKQMKKETHCMLVAIEWIHFWRAYMLLTELVWPANVINGCGWSLLNPS